MDIGEIKMENINQIDRKQSRAGSVKYSPSRDDIAKATEEFLNKGGRINQLQPDEKSFKQSWINVDVSTDVDEFLLGQ